MSERLTDFIWTPTIEDLAKEHKFIEEEILTIGRHMIGEMLRTAALYRESAYTPYSHYDVGAAILTADGEIYGGCNSENVNYSATNHAEGTAIATANAAGKGKENRKYIKALVVCHEGDSGPCGECLQRIVEHADNCLIIVADPEGKVRKITSLKAILPYNFNPSHLGL